MKKNEYALILCNFKGILFWKTYHFNEHFINEKIVNKQEVYTSISKYFPDLEKNRICCFFENENHISDANPTILLNGKTKIYGNVVFIKNNFIKPKGLSIEEIQEVIQTTKVPTKTINTNECPEIIINL